MFSKNARLAHTRLAGSGGTARASCLASPIDYVAR